MFSFFSIKLGTKNKISTRIHNARYSKLLTNIALIANRITVALNMVYKIQVPFFFLLIRSFRLIIVSLIECLFDLLNINASFHKTK